MEVVDGKVVISSEELAAAIQTQQIDLGRGYRHKYRRIYRL